MTDLSVVIVTHNSAAEIAGLLASLPAAGPGLVLQTLVVDNASTDDTAAVVAGFSATWVPSGGNLGYSGGINAARPHLAPDASAVAVLNPDLVARPGALTRLVEELRDGVGVTVPRIVDADGRLFASLRREPRLLGALGEAVFGGAWAGRPEVLGDTLRHPDDYAADRDVEWASGAALVVDRAVWDATGPWDEGFFLYSEEVEYLRRVRAAGHRIRYVADAVVEHIGGASGSSPALDALQAVNRLRDYASVHSGAATLAFRGVLVAQHAVRALHRPGSRAALPYLVGLRDRTRLPHAVPAPPPPPAEDVTGSVVIPAHNEGRVIGRLLDSLADGLAPGVEVIVACNGCTDDTVLQARRHGAALGAVVLNLPEPSKVGALNAADAAATRFPRAYIDADVEVSGRTVTAVLDRLAKDEAPSGRPPLAYDTEGADPLVRAFYRARSATPSLMTQLWGAGFFAVTRAGRERWGAWPTTMPDDLLVNSHFDAGEKLIVPTEPVRVRVPRTTSALTRTLARVYRPQQQGGVDDEGRQSSGGTLAELLRHNLRRGLPGVLDATAYVALVVSGRWQARRTGGANLWERDGTTR